MNECKHKNWGVPDDVRIGMGYCYDCKKTVLLSTLFDNLRVDMQELITQIKDALQQVRTIDTASQNHSKMEQ